MIARQSETGGGSSLRAVWLALAFICKLNAWRPLSTHDSPLEAGRACLRAFQLRWHEIGERARHLRTLTEHLDVADTAPEGIDGATLARQAHELSTAIESQNQNVARLLDEPRPGDDVQFDGAPGPGSGGEARPGDDGDPMRMAVYKTLETIHAAPVHVSAMLQRVLDAPATEDAILRLAVELTFPGDTLSRAWGTPLLEFVHTAYRLRASVAALQGQAVGSFDEFCAQQVAESLDGTVLDLNPSTVTLGHLAQIAALLEQEQERQAGDGEASVIVTLMFLDPELVATDGPLDRDVADALLVRAVRSVILRLHEHHGTLISPSAPDLVTQVTLATLRAISAQAGVVQEPMEHASTPVMHHPGGINHKNQAGLTEPDTE